MHTTLPHLTYTNPPSVLQSLLENYLLWEHLKLTEAIQFNWTIIWLPCGIIKIDNIHIQHLNVAKKTLNPTLTLILVRLNATFDAT